MAFPLDASQPFLLPSQLRLLAEAVRDAGPHDEATWIEWKSTLDLSAPHALVHLVKQTLGLGNRSPDEAAKRAGGYGYLLVGVEPGSVLGVDSIDPSDMEQDLTPYLGPDLVWNAEYVTLDGKDVLIVVVNPPRFGDPIHYLRKGLPHPNPSKGVKFVHAEHTVFIRKNGRTMAAGPEDWQMLHQRFAAARNRLEIEVVAARPDIERIADFPEHVKVHLDRHPRRLLAHRTLGAITGDDRTRAQYETEVEAHMDELREVFAQRLHDEMLRHSPAALSLTLVNRSDRPFQGVRVTATVRAEGRIFCLGPVDDELPKFKLPAPPRAWGTRRQPVFPTSTFLGRTHAPMPAGLLATMCRWEVHEVPGGLEIEFDPEDVRPRERLDLKHVPLLVSADAETELTVEWTAAGLSAEGSVSGRFVIPVVDSTLQALTGKDLGKWGLPADEPEQAEQD
ncbi:AlbA family DNA-binding domain-containing protein [Thermomonospora umbrina]|uniref:Schlafen AlbA-2 domain-containing protein n=1 Tax=Thermomonospora umbrina TaxID=111806 RepID=A0A3D9SWW2_9ACTN|nr:RNA-binding domain-containing protein [Thermomonospora umbrina]REE99000.1 hypothetical protein DFJ69_4499 [Thermomonospora umbrina]